jgi:hypothetical protein
MCYSWACAVGIRGKEKDGGNRCRTPKSPRCIDLVEIRALMATVGKKKCDSIVAKGVLREGGRHFDEAWGKQRREMED